MSAKQPPNIPLCERCGTRMATHAKRGREGDFTPLCDTCDPRIPTPSPEVPRDR